MRPEKNGSMLYRLLLFFFSSRRRHTRFDCDWSSDVCSSDLVGRLMLGRGFLEATTKHQPTNTPAISLLYALEAQLARIEREGGAEGRWRRHEIGRASCRERV